MWCSYGQELGVLFFLTHSVYTVSQKRPLFYFLNNSIENWPILINFGILNPQKIWHENLTDSSISLVRCSHFPLGNQKKIIFQHYYSYTSNYLCYLRRKNSNCCTVGLSVYLLLFSVPVICIALVLHLGQTTGGARVLIRTCCGSGLLRRLNFSTALCTMRLISVEKTGSMY